MFYPGGKLGWPSLGSPGGGTKVINRLYFSDRTSKSKYLIDIGADVFIVPLTAASKHRPLASLNFFATNFTAISTYGQCLLTLDFGLRRVFRGPFIIAAISQPIIGTDFLRHYGLLSDIRHECLVNSLTKLQTQETVQRLNHSGVKATNDNTKIHRLLAERFIPHAAKTQAVLNSYLKGTKRNDRISILRSEDFTAAFEKCKKDLEEASFLYHRTADALIAIVVSA
ncbi:retrovirus-related Pol polyprotein from transposon 297 [Nephila pilipes]|uniref:Retrovirus-related Pol polyprotein from transposon 297 n=1 Tax=Nephila pilipes TaxID=299642 RepID=A0A8X6TJP9_NEPPI|nr:retrovirus-related Pol polyprotein from transposon 297 [Nephila pilipes]